ncbi:MAG: site-specific integrase [Acidimicrobiales bacterium]|nr:site-specific integrase [Acidimicrobiales bacterium]
MPAKPSVRWNEQKKRWMAWVGFPDGSRRKVERVNKRDAQDDLEELLALRDHDRLPERRHVRQGTFEEVVDAWFEADCPNVSPTRKSRHARAKSPKTIEVAHQALYARVLPVIGQLRVDQTSTERLERLFEDMAKKSYASTTIDHTWNYLNQACQHGVRTRRIRRNPAADVLLPAIRPQKRRKAFTLDQVEKLLVDGIPDDPKPAMWLTGLMCGLRPGELAGLRWPFVDIDSESPCLRVEERSLELGDKYVGQAAPKTERSKRTLALHPLLVAALARHRMEQKLLGLYDAEGFVFPSNRGTPMTMSNLRTAFKRLCKRAGLGEDWTTYELRHSFVSLVADQLDDLVKVADLAGHTDTRTTEIYRHPVRESLPHAVEAWDRLLNSRKPD